MKFTHALNERREISVDQVRVIRDYTLEKISRNMRHALANAAESHDAERHFSGTTALAV